MWESWFFSNDTYSHNHGMFTSGEVYMYQALAGIQPHPAARGFDRVLIKPKPVPDLTFVNASFESVRGVVEVRWTLQAGAFDLHVVIPPNVVATVTLPGQSGSHMQMWPEQRSVPSSFETGSGSYRFSSWLLSDLN